MSKFWPLNINLQNYVTSTDYPAASYTPSDAGYKSQWHLKNNSYPGMDLNVATVWDDYKGKGVKIGILDEGFDYKHKDLAANYDTALDWDFSGNDADPYITGTNKHGTAVAGVIAADDNGTGTVGVAPDAMLVGYKIDFSSASLSTIVAAFDKATANVDILNNSWGYTGIFSDNKLSSAYGAYFNAIENMAKNGRGGLGTIAVFSAGNSLAAGDNVNHHNTQNSPYTIAVGSIDKNGDFSYYSTPGAAVLVSAPGRTIYTTDNTGASGYLSGDYATVSGTSFSAPAVSGVIALMLEANKNLGYRDVQEILAYSAKNSDYAHTGWQTNGANNWNNGGLHFSHQYGFGIIDAHAAVRMAETWDKTSSFTNMDKATFSANPNIAIPDKQLVNSSLTVSSDIEINHVLVTVYLSHASVGNLQLKLISPGGTESVLLNYPGATSSNTAGSSTDMTAFEFSTVANWGESSKGVWTLQAYDRISGTTGILKNWNLTFLGDKANADDTYIYTNEYIHGSSTVLSDSDGTDTINASSVAGDSIIDLNGSAVGLLAGKSFQINGAVIENVHAGDGNDTLYGNAAGNIITGGRGNDIIHGSAGNDTLNGGQGMDTAIYISALQQYVVQIISAMEAVISHAITGIDRLLNFEWFSFSGTKYSFQDMADYASGTAPPVIPDPDPPSSGDLPPVELTFGIVKPTGTTTTFKTVSDHTGISVSSSADLKIGASLTDRALIIDRQDSYLRIDSESNNCVQFISIVTDVAIDYDIANISVVNFNTESAGQSIDLTVDGMQSGTIYATGNADIISLEIRNNNGNTGSTYNTIKAYLGDGDDEITLSGDNPSFKSLIDLGNGNDIYQSSVAGAETIYGRAGNDLIETANSADKLYGHDGDDILHSGAGNDYIYGGNGNDRIFGGDDNDYVRGDAGNDQLYGGSGDDRIYGGNESDIIDGGNGNDFLDGGYGNDTLYTSQGTDSLRGGAGQDTFVIQNSTGISRIEDFSLSQKDKLDISNILTGFDQSDVLDDFMRMAYNSSKGVTEIQINSSGASGENYIIVSELRGNFSGLDLDALLTSGQIITG